MNCKPGDFAVIVSTPPWAKFALGRILRVTTNFESDGLWYWNYEGDLLVAPNGRVANEVEDMYLRPIRDNDGEDETLIWAGKPAQHKETA